MQARAFEEVVAASGLAELQSPAYYRWKYRTPWGEARIASVWEGSELVAGNAMYPLGIVWRDRSLLAWQSCDTATLREARGRGHFLACQRALEKELADDALLFGFPNSNSMPGFLKLGWETRAEVRAFARILPGRRARAFADLERAEGGLASFEALAKRVGAQDGPMIEHSSAYLGWRYPEHPIYPYEIFGRRERDGLIVLREAAFGGLRMGIVMDLLAEDSRIERRLMSFAAAWTREKRLPFTVLFSSTLPRALAARAAFLPVPGVLSPKRQVLMGWARGPESSAFWQPTWRMQIGDWDGL
jgi:hypothetical protein